jgi:prepilin-type processing-associated H-X9-DG protein
MERLAVCSRSRSGSAIRGRRRGITLVELLVVVVIVFLAVILALPGLKAAQQQARRAACADNLKQIGLALHNYHASWDCFPMSATAGGKGRGVGHSGFASILPFIEEIPLYNCYNFSLENWHVANSTSVGTRLATYLCPDNGGNLDPMPGSDVLTPEGKAYPQSKSLFARSHYGANWGGGHAGWGDDFVKSEKTYRGVMMTVVDEKHKDRSRIIRLADITDGTSDTLIMAEKLDSQGWGVGGWGGSEFDVAEHPNYDGKDVKGRRVFSGSTHEGGLNVLYCDGSVRFLPSSTDRKVWYSLITRDGGERVKEADHGTTPR